MSAWVVDKKHIDLIVKCSIVGPRDAESWMRPTWATNDSDDWREREYCEATLAEADRIGFMLATENVASVCYRYDDDSADMYEDMLSYEYGRGPVYAMTCVEALKALSFLEYQSCEHPGWETSEAKRFCEAVRDSVIHALPGMDAAPWGWDIDEIGKRSSAKLAA